LLTQKQYYYSQNSATHPNTPEIYSYIQNCELYKFVGKRDCELYKFIVVLVLVLVLPCVVGLEG
jgi:hypothetical protein